MNNPNIPKWWYGVEFYFRNNSTGNPTLAHIINPVTNKSYCGFTDRFAENIIGDETDTFVASQVCKKCRKAYDIFHPIEVFLEPYKAMCLELDANKSRQKAVQYLMEHDGTLDIAGAASLIQKWVDTGDKYPARTYTREEIINAMTRFGSFCNEKELPAQTLRTTAIKFFEKYIENSHQQIKS